MPGTLALGVHSKAVTDAAKSDKYLSLAEELTRTCREMYAQNPTGTDAALHQPNWQPRIFKCSDHLGACLAWCMRACLPLIL